MAPPVRPVDSPGRRPSSPAIQHRAKRQTRNVILASLLVVMIFQIVIMFNMQMQVNTGTGNSVKHTFLKEFTNGRSAAKLGRRKANHEQISNVINRISETAARKEADDRQIKPEKTPHRRLETPDPTSFKYEGKENSHNTSDFMNSSHISAAQKTTSYQQISNSIDGHYQQLENHPIPPFLSKEGKIMFNPEEFRTGDKNKYVNKPIDCDGESCNQAAQQKAEMKIPDPIGLKYEGGTPSNNNDVIVSVISSVSLITQALKRLIYSIRNTGYDGHIILGVIMDEISPKNYHFLKAHNVITYILPKVPCGGKPGKFGDLAVCVKSLEMLPREWALYELARQWINACKTCTGRVLLALDGGNTIFQSHPFAAMEGRIGTEELLFSEELAAHTNPLYVHDPDNANNPVRHKTFDKAMLVNCYQEVDLNKLIGPNRPVLSPTAVVGNKNAVQRYLSVMNSELQKDNDLHGCHVPSLSDTAIMNYLYYTGAFGFPDTIAILPWGYGIFQNLEKPCRNKFASGDNKKHTSHLDMMTFDFNHTGYITNRYVPANDAVIKIAPAITSYRNCDKWFKAFLRIHGELAGAPLKNKPHDYLGILEHAIFDSIKDRSHISGGKELHPMKTSYQRSTVVQQAPWFPAVKICRETCCAQSIAISLDQDEDHLITSVDGLDLADVAILGHKRGPNLQWAISDLVKDIVPCLQPNTIIYADHEAGGVNRFFDVYRPLMDIPFLLITGGSDGVEPSKPMSIGRKWLETDTSMIRWYGINPCYKCGADDPKFKMMQLGLGAIFDQQKFLFARLKETGFSNPFAEEKKSKWTDSVELTTATDTTHILFVKFGINKHSQHRWEPYNMACQNRTGTPMDGVTCSTGLKKFHSTEIYHSAEKYLFGLSPPGNGYDCYRTYEFFFLGVIPVVRYMPENAELYRGLPVLQLETWNLTQMELVIKMRDYIQSPAFQDTVFDGWDRLFLKYWRTRVLKETGRLGEIMEDDHGNQYYKSWTYTRYTEPYQESRWPPKKPLETIEHQL